MKELGKKKIFRVGGGEQDMNIFRFLRELLDLGVFGLWLIFVIFKNNYPLILIDYESAMKRVRLLLEVDYEAESAKKVGTPSASTTDVIYAVFEAFSK